MSATGATFFCVIGLLSGVWLGTTATAGTVATTCEREGKWDHTSFIFKPSTLRITCAGASNR